MQTKYFWWNLAYIEMCCKYKIHTGFQKQKKCIISVIIFQTDYMLK